MEKFFLPNRGLAASGGRHPSGGRVQVRGTRFRSERLWCYGPKSCTTISVNGEVGAMNVTELRKLMELLEMIESLYTTTRGFSFATSYNYRDFQKSKQENFNVSQN
jgi:hypothetical protein